MSQQARDLLSLPFIASSAVMAYRCVDFTGAPISAAGSRIAGVAKRPAAAGEAFEAACIGTAVIEAGAAIAVGQPLIADAQGRAVPSSGDPAQFVIAHALQAAGAAGQCIEALLSR